MNLFKASILGMLAIYSLTPATSSAGEASSINITSYPKPYIYSDSGLGEDPKFTLNNSGLLPDWLSLAVQQRTRYETLDNAFRSNSTGSDQVLALRTLTQATLNLHRHFKVQLEMQDSRAELNDSGSVVNTTLINTAELLEANLQWTSDGLVQDGSHSIFRAGRLTMDFGKRRLMARNRFRNTKNAFTGVDGIWQAKSGETVRALFTLPVNREPTVGTQLLQNDAHFDKATTAKILWGLFVSTPNLKWESKAEMYLFGYYEDDSPTLSTNNRKLYTPGFRLYRPNKTGRFDYEWESILQFGTSRATTAATDTRDLDHFAHFNHAEVGYTFSMPWTPRLILAYDHASGDENPNDEKNGSFFSLYGASVFDYGPSSINGAFSRSNITGPGAKFYIQPHQNFKASMHYRAFWLASATAKWAGNSGLRDTSGNSGSFLGQQVFLRGAWQTTDNLRLEGGVNYRVNGDFQATVPNGPRRGNSTYTYLSVSLSF
jgi:hypothetical protein